jgi:hypothetical protein
MHIHHLHKEYFKSHSHTRSSLSQNFLPKSYTNSESLPYGKKVETRPYIYLHKKLVFSSNSSGQESERRPLCVNRGALEIRSHGRQTSGKTDNCGHANACPNDRKHTSAAPARMLPTVARLLLLLTSSSIWSNRCWDLSNLCDGYGGDGRL